MLTIRSVVCTLLVLFANTCAKADDNKALADQVRNAERAFAATLAARDYAAFREYLADEAVFFNGAETLRGKTAVAAGWKEYFEGSAAPFSWSPEIVEVLDSGTLALSSGPVLDPAGKRVGRFNTIWRREADGRWRVVFDKGCSCSQKQH
jgi:ketosteroid isomerase-like protein